VLGQQGYSEAVEAIQWVAAGDANPNVVQAAIEALGQMRNRASIAALIELTADPQRVSACVIALSHPDATGGVLGEEGMPKVGRNTYEWIGVGLTHPNPGVRSAVVDALTRLKHPRASEILVAALEDRESSVRLRAIRALGYLGNRSAEQQLAAIARTDIDPAVRRAAHRAMQRYKD
jgi:HEAT repeat protein